MPPKPPTSNRYSRPTSLAGSSRPSSISGLKPPPRTTTPATLTAALRATQIAPSYAFTPSGIPTQKAALPAEILDLILDYVSVADLLVFARTSRRLKEMVWEDARWVRRLRCLGVWDESEARKREGQARKLQANGVINGSALGGRGVEDEGGFRASEVVVGGGGSAGAHVGISSGSDNKKGVLEVLRRVKSVRGKAMVEYAKIHAALGPYYFDITKVLTSTSTAEPLLFRTFREPEHQAVMLAQLRTFQLADWASGREGREARLASISGMFETAALREFEGSIRSGDVMGNMKRYAHVLFMLNGGAAAADAWIESNNVMRRAKEGGFGRPRDCIANAFSGSITMAPAEGYFRQIATELNDQMDTLDIVFPPQMDILTPFVERLIDDAISEYITELVDEAHAQSMEAYLKAVSGVFELSLRFVISLKSGKTTPPEFQKRIKETMIRCFDRHLDLYFTEELEFFKKRAEDEVYSWGQRLLEQETSTETFFMSNVSRQAAKQDFMSSFKSMMLLPVTAVASIPGTFTSKKTPTSHIESTLTEKRSSTPVPLDRYGTPLPPESAPTSELAAKAAIMNSRLEGIKTLFSIEVALNLVHSAKTSLERTAVFVKPLGEAGTLARTQCEAIFVTLVHILGTKHVQQGFDKAVNHLSDYKPREIESTGRARGKVAPLVTFLELVNVGDLIQQMIDVFYSQELVAAKLTDPDDFLSPGIKEKKRFEQMLDERVAAGLNKGIDVLMDEVEYICATLQSPEDFNPPMMVNGKIKIMDVGPSQAAIKVVEIVEGHVGMLVGSTDKTVLDVFNQEVGARLFSVLCKHIKRQRISVDGSIKLISDINHYHAYVRTLKQKDLMEYFNVLRELTQIYLVSPDDAKEIGVILADTDRYRGILTPEEVFEFAERRADWFLVKKDVEKAMYGMGCSVM